MKKILMLAAFATVLAGCSKNEIVDKTTETGKEVPIAFAPSRTNVTKATTALESNLHYNFGVWASKVSSTKEASPVMANYLVGYSNGTNKGYDKSGATTWASGSGTTGDHTSPWFYEKLGNTEYTYTGDAGFYKSTQTAYMSANANQYLRYWDLAYTNTNFFCYAPYKSTGVTCTVNSDGSATMTFGATNSIRDGYDKPLNSTYKTGTDANPSLDRSLTEFMYAGVQATNASLTDITVPFKHMNSQLYIRFYEDIPGYKVEMIELNGDNGTMASSATDDQKLGIQATPSKKNADDSYSLGTYYTTAGASVAFTSAAVPTFTSNWTGATTSQANLMFYIPSTTSTDYSAANVPTGYAANLSTFATDHKVIAEAVTTGTQAYSWSPSIYYPVAQPQSTDATNYKANGFTFHVSFRLIAEDNNEIVTVHNATVHVPCSATTWAAGNRYIYTFKITKTATGTTDPAATINPTDPTPSTVKSMFPIVFDGCTVDDYQDVAPDNIIS